METPADDVPPYDPPVITDLGSLSELTAGPATGTDDGLSGLGGGSGGGF